MNDSSRINQRKVETLVFMKNRKETKRKVS